MRLPVAVLPPSCLALVSTHRVSASPSPSLTVCPSYPCQSCQNIIHGDLKAENVLLASRPAEPLLPPPTATTTAAPTAASTTAPTTTPSTSPAEAPSSPPPLHSSPPYSLAAVAALRSPLRPTAASLTAAGPLSPIASPLKAFLPSPLKSLQSPRKAHLASSGASGSAAAAGAPQGASSASASRPCGGCLLEGRPAGERLVAKV
jgi:hypothetical protein